MNAVHQTPHVKFIDQIEKAFTGIKNHYATFTSAKSATYRDLVKENAEILKQIQIRQKFIDDAVKNAKLDLDLVTANDREQKWCVRSLNYDLIQVEQRNQDIYDDLRQVGLDFHHYDSLEKEKELNQRILLIQTTDLKNTQYLLDTTIYSIDRLTSKGDDKYQLGRILERRPRELRGKKHTLVAPTNNKKVEQYKVPVLPFETIVKQQLNNYDLEQIYPLRSDRRPRSKYTSLVNGTKVKDEQRQPQGGKLYSSI